LWTNLGNNVGNLMGISWKQYGTHWEYKNFKINSKPTFGKERNWSYLNACWFISLIHGSVFFFVHGNSILDCVASSFLALVNGCLSVEFTLLFPMCSHQVLNGFPLTPHLVPYDLTNHCLLGMLIGGWEMGLWHLEWLFLLRGSKFQNYFYDVSIKEAHCK
jgi:hypothetical protein